MRERTLLIGLCLIALASIAAFMTVDLKGNPAFALQLRGVRLLALINVAVAIAVSTVVFQTITGNRILTPAIMGLDALYQFGQIALVFALGGLGYITLSPYLKFGMETAGLMVLAAAILLPAFKSRMDLGLMLLTGVVIGALFRSLSQFLARLVDPQEFAVAQASMFANFSSPDTDLLLIASAVTCLAVIGLWLRRHDLDIIALGRDTATSLGIDWNRTVGIYLLVVSALVAVSTALVGPVTFFGLIVVALAERLIAARRHAILFVAASLVGIIIMVGGQTVLQHGLGQASTLSVVVDFLGGLVFIFLLFKSYRR